MLKNKLLAASVFGFTANFLLFLVKVYVGISSSSLSIYCDAVNNLGDTFACAAALGGFLLIRRLGERQSLRLQSLLTFVISLIIALTGGYFVYNGLERVMYPLPVSYLTKYAVIISITIIVKLLMGLFFRFINKKEGSAVLKALELDSFLDCFITLSTLMSLVLVGKLGFAADGIFAIITGSVITVSAVKSLVHETKYLIND